MRHLVLLAILAMATALHAAVPVRQSQQFKVLDLRPITAASPGPLKSEKGEELIRLDADVLIVSAERVRDALRTQLALPKEGGGDIQLNLYLATRPGDLIRLAAGLSPRGWEYQMEIPDQVERQTLIRALVGVLLLEFANRGQGPKSADIPLWLVEGLTMHVSAVAGPDLIVGAVPLGGMLPTVRVWRGSDYRLDYLQHARAVLRSSRPMTFSELGHPTSQTLAGDRLKTFQSSAQLLVHELLRSKTGPAGFVSMLRDLPSCWNWETAFLHGYSADFPRMLEVEKWWAVNLLAFTSRDPSQVWSKQTCLDQLDAVLQVPARVRVTDDVLPQRQTLSLQQVITNWDFGLQVPVLQQKLLSLAALRFNAFPEVLDLVNGYQQALATYLQRRSQANRAPATRMQPTYNGHLLTKDILGDLEDLDKRRQALRPDQTLSVNSTISP